MEMDSSTTSSTVDIKALQELIEKEGAFFWI